MPITRRMFLGDALLATCAFPGWMAYSEPGSRRVLKIDQIVFDARRPQALEFADMARRLGASTRAICGEALPGPWFGNSCARWRSRKRAVAGITDFRSLYLMQAMAADHGLRPVLRIHHHAGRTVAAHEAFGAQAYRIMSNERLANSGEHWACEAARLVLSLPKSESTPRATGSLRSADQRTLGSRALVTWVMVGG